MTITYIKGIELDKLEYSIYDFKFDFFYMLKQLRPEGFMVYEYNPFNNYRLSGNRDSKGNIEGEDKDYNPKDEVGITEAGSVVDLDSKYLNFSLNNPVTMTCQHSYDGSVNLILNDNLNQPRLINSRFSVQPLNRYKIVDRAGNNDTNLYDSGQFELDTSLYKRVDNIPKIHFNGIGYGGNFKVGNYVFYFKLSDADRNETDFIGESGIVTCHIGNINDPHSIRGGISDENSYKSISFTLSNIDSSYDYVTVYYTRSTSDSNGIEVVSAHKFDKLFPVSNLGCNLYLTGSESINTITLEEINAKYFIADKVVTQTPCQNIMFFGNVHQASIDYANLADLSLRLLPYYGKKDSKGLIGSLDSNYVEEYAISTPYEYYNAKNIYNHTGYWNEEIYRLGVVWLLNNNTLSPVFNIRGLDKIPLKSTGMKDYSQEPVYDEKGKRNFIKINDNYRIGQRSDIIENSKGVIRIVDGSSDVHQVYSIGVAIDSDVLKELKGKVKGMFLVRQKRIPNILAQVMTMGFDQNSGVPVICKKNEERFIESFVNQYGVLTNNYSERLYNQYDEKDKNKSLVNTTALCPEFEIRQPFFNNIFTGTKFTYRESTINTGVKELYVDTSNARHYYIPKYAKTDLNKYDNVTISALGDNTPIIRDKYYSYRARAGEAEEAYKFRMIDGDTDLKFGDNRANKIVRGSFGPYLAISGYKGRANTLLNIYIPDYDEIYMKSYFSIRYEDNSAFYPITDRISLEELNNLSASTSSDSKTKIRSNYLDNIYRGDCFICNFTHRLNRNFQDTEAPNNDEIVDPNTFKDNYTKGDSEKNALINRGDVNAVQLGSWITFKVYSSINLSMRNWDDGYPSENGLTGVNRSFYPLSTMSTEGNAKIPESFVINTGESSTTSDKYNFVLPDVPYIKNEFGTRIVYSDVTINDAFKNGYRVFQDNHYRDYPMTYGGIIRLVELYGNLLCVFEHGVALIPINERAIAGEGAGGNVYINTSNVLPENPKMLSDMFGSQWSESVIKTPYYVYGIDTIAKKIWRTNGETFEVISDFKVQKFLNDNISLSEREHTPVIGVRNVKTHYNAYKGDVMFTFYDNLYGFEEKAWNLCYNEVLQKWVTLYSWLPSYSENIDNIFFSFNRNTSKWITKLGTSQEGSTNADGIVLSNVVLTTLDEKIYFNITNRALPDINSDSKIHYDYKIVKDNFRNYEHFEQGEDEKGQYIKFIVDPSKPNEFYENPVWLLNAQVKITIQDYDPDDPNLGEYINGWNEYTTTNFGYYQSVLAISSDKVVNNPMLSDKDRSLPSLTTDFWKHGRSGIIDIKEDIKPCYWYGEQHPFEFEFVVADKPGAHKIFNNLQIVSNKAQPESFHYEIVGEAYDWAHDKKNAYVRQESTKELYQNLGSDILYDRKYTKLRDDSRYVIIKNPKTNKNELRLETPGLIRNIKSTIFPWYYERIDTFNDIYDSYQLATSKYAREYQNLSGTEIVWDDQLNEFKLLIHTKGADFKELGRLRGNMQYQEDLWLIEIPPIYFRQKNEVVDQFGIPIKTPDWNGKNYPPIIINNLPNDIKADVITLKSLPKFN